MRNAIGFLIVLWGLSTFFGTAIKDFESAASATFGTIETAAKVSEKRLLELDLP